MFVYIFTSSSILNGNNVSHSTLTVSIGFVCIEAADKTKYWDFSQWEHGDKGTDSCDTHLLAHSWGPVRGRESLHPQHLLCGRDPPHREGSRLLILPGYQLRPTSCRTAQAQTASQVGGRRWGWVGCVWHLGGRLSSMERRSHSTARTGRLSAAQCLCPGYCRWSHQQSRFLF